MAEHFALELDSDLDAVLRVKAQVGIGAGDDQRRSNPNWITSGDFHTADSVRTLEGWFFRSGLFGCRFFSRRLFGRGFSRRGGATGRQ